MARLRNRITKADFYTDPELLRWHRDKREFYRRLWAIAEDSGCLEDDPFGWKLILYPSPLDADVTLDMMGGWRDELTGAGKLIPYEADGKGYLYVRNFHQHEQPRNPQRPDLPLPPWVHYERTVVKRGDGEVSRNTYRVDTDAIPPRNSDSETTLLSPPSSPVQSSPVPSKRASKHAPARVGAVDKSDASSEPDPPKRRQRSTPTCDGGPCRVRELRCGIRRDVAMIVGEVEAASLYGGNSDLSKTFLKYAARVCAQCQAQFGSVERPERDAKCIAALRGCVSSILAVHRKTPIQNLPAYLNGELSKLTHLGDLVGDDLVRELRAAAHGKRAKRGDLEQVKAVLPEIAQPPGDACSFPVSA